jgi:hypothetical protein
LELANDDVSRRLKNLGVTIKAILDKAYLIDK